MIKNFRQQNLKILNLIIHKIIKKFLVISVEINKGDKIFLSGYQARKTTLMNII